MIVVTLTDCPPKLRGDLSKWLFEINNGVYVGNLSTRVREELWERICGNLSSGRATAPFCSGAAPGRTTRCPSCRCRRVAAPKPFTPRTARRPPWY